MRNYTNKISILFIRRNYVLWAENLPDDLHAKILSPKFPASK